MTPAAAPLLRLRGLTKRYPNGVLANDDVSLDIEAGEVHAIVGENGAGKSTVMKLLYGLERPDAGTLELDGKPCAWRTPRDAIAAGIGLVPQHLELVPSFSVAENLVLGIEPRRGWLFDRVRASAQVRALAERHGLALDPQAPVDSLSVGQQQRVEILKALHRGARVLLLDEPTALLSPQEADDLFVAVRALAAAGATVVLISHKMSEVRTVSDRFTVMRAGRVVGRGRSRDCSEDALAEMIMGPAGEGPAGPLPVRQARPTGPTSPVRLSVRGLTLVQPGARPVLRDVSLDVASGEILGVAGVEGNGQDGLVDVLAGLRRPDAGTLWLDGQPLPAGQVAAMRQRGVASVCADRLHGGVAPSLSIADNLAANDYRGPALSRAGWLRPAALAERARRVIADYGVRARDAAVALGSLSGGNMQKVVLARELLGAPRLLVASQPTRGVDIGAARGLHQALRSLRDGGAALLLVSSDLDELLALSDRVIVLFEGRVVAHLDAAGASPRVLGLYMTGLACDDGAGARQGAPFSPAPPAGRHGAAA